MDEQQHEVLSGPAVAPVPPTRGEVAPLNAEKKKGWFLPTIFGIVTLFVITSAVILLNVNETVKSSAEGYVDFSFLGSVKAVFLNTNKEYCGVGNTAGAIQIKGCEVDEDGTGFNMTINNLPNGNYTLDVWSLENGIFNMDIESASKEGGIATNDVWGYNHAKTVQYKVVVNWDNKEQPVKVEEPLPHPTSVTSKPIVQNGKTLTQIDWQPVAGADHYSVYFMPEGHVSAGYTLLKDTKTTSVVTPHIWAGQTSLQKFVYVIAAVDPSGKESFLSFTYNRTSYGSEQAVSEPANYSSGKIDEENDWAKSSQNFIYFADGTTYDLPVYVMNFNGKDKRLIGHLTQPQTEQATLGFVSPKATYYIKSDKGVSTINNFQTKILYSPLPQKVGYDDEVEWSPDEKYLAYMNDAGSLVIYDVLAKKTLKTAVFIYDDRLSESVLAWKEDSSTLYVSDDDAITAITNLASGQPTTSKIAGLAPCKNMVYIRDIFYCTLDAAKNNIPVPAGKGGTWGAQYGPDVFVSQSLSRPTDKPKLIVTPSNNDAQINKLYLVDENYLVFEPILGPNSIVNIKDGTIRPIEESYTSQVFTGYVFADPNLDRYRQPVRTSI